MVVVVVDVGSRPVYARGMFASQRLTGILK